MPEMGRSTRTTTGLASAPFTSTQQKVLALLFGQPERMFIHQELIEEAGGGSGAVRRELTSLVESGLVVATTAARQRQFCANREKSNLRRFALTDPACGTGDSFSPRTPIRRTTTSSLPRNQLKTTIDRRIRAHHTGISSLRSRAVNRRSARSESKPGTPV